MDGENERIKKLQFELVQEKLKLTPTSSSLIQEIEEENSTKI